jgi:pimeloyl-ACP methyl ester carboxylesterase
MPVVMRKEIDRPKSPSRWLRVLVSLVLMVGVPIALIAGCQSKLLYFPRPYAPGLTEEWRDKTAGRPVDFTTSQGRQRAFLQGNLKSPRNLWIVCGGNGTVALDWSDWIAKHAPKEDAWLLVDFPGYGDCEGKPSPARIRESLRVVVPVAVESVGLTAKPDASRLRFFGHSLGAAASLIAAKEFGMQQGVLLSPFTSTMEMSEVVTGLPLGLLVTHRYDNGARLDEVIKRGSAKVVIVHGTDDEVIPVEMGRKLARGRENAVRLVEVPGARHNDVAQNHPETLARALRDSGGGMKPPSP